MILFSLSPSAPYLATPLLSLHRIGCKHIPPYFAFPIVRPIHDRRTTTAVRSGRTNQAPDQLVVAARLLTDVMGQRALPRSVYDHE